MDSKGFMQAFQNELTCSICMNYFIDPVTIDCGHSFCRPCLYLCWEEDQTPKSCPECRGLSEKPDFKTNIVLKRLASLARQDAAKQTNSLEGQICLTHKEAKGLFCEVDKTLLCGPCSESPEHAAHSHSPIQWAAEEYRVSGASKAIRNLQAPKSERKMRIIMKKVMIKDQYQRIHLFLQEQEQLHLEVLEEEAKEILQQLRESEFRMTQQKESLKEMYRELTEMCHKPDLELLQVRREVPSSETEMQKPQPVNPELTSWPVTGILDVLNSFREESNWIDHLSEDDTTMIYGDDHHGVSRELQGAESFVAWGAVAFTSGRHYWEVDVTHSSNWILGVCKDILTSNTVISIDSEEAFLLSSMKVNNHYILSTNSPPLIQYVQRPLGGIGVFLDYDNGTVSFYDVCRGSLIYTFLPSFFSSPLKPFLCLRSP
uniref:Tripartite motif-containing protein 64-like n=1 Tax=Phocoena sinus TaxID=42100 RepID=A0A8C9E4H6_PHOSS